MTDRKLATLLSAALLAIVGTLALAPISVTAQQIPKTPDGAWMLPANPEEAATAELVGQIDHGTAA